MASQSLRDSSLTELLQRLSTDTAALVRDEFDLAKAEVADKGREVGAGAGLLAGAAVIAVAAVGAFTAFAILALAHVLPAYGAALIVFGLWLLVAGALALVAKRRLQQAVPPVPEEAVESVKEDIEWAKNLKK